MNPTAGEFVGNFSNSNVAGNCKIYYTHPYHQYLPDESVGANNIDSGNAVAGEVLRADGSGGANFYDLQLGTAAQEDTGTASGDVATLGTGGRFHVDRLGWSGSQTAFDALTPDAGRSTVIILDSGPVVCYKWVMKIRTHISIKKDLAFSTATADAKRLGLSLSDLVSLLLVGNYSARA